LKSKKSVVIVGKRVPGFCCQVTEGIDTIRRGTGYLFSVLKDSMVAGACE